jgi:hypothetical protein
MIAECALTSDQKEFSGYTRQIFLLSLDLKILGLARLMKNSTSDQIYFGWLEITQGPLTNSFG